MKPKMGKSEENIITVFIPSIITLMPFVIQDIQEDG